MHTGGKISSTISFVACYCISPLSPVMPLILFPSHLCFLLPFVSVALAVFTPPFSSLHISLVFVLTLPPFSRIKKPHTSSVLTLSLYPLFLSSHPSLLGLSLVYVCVSGLLKVRSCLVLLISGMTTLCYGEIWHVGDLSGPFLN